MSSEGSRTEQREEIITYMVTAQASANPARNSDTGVAFGDVLDEAKGLGLWHITLSHLHGGHSLGQGSFLRLRALAGVIQV